MIEDWTHSQKSESNNQNQCERYFIDPWGEIACITAAPIQSARNMQEKNRRRRNIYKQEQQKQNKNTRNVHSTRISPYIQCHK